MWGGVGLDGDGDEEEDGKLKEEFKTLLIYIQAQLLSLN